MKRIVFLIIASLLVIGLVLPGCDNGVTPRERPVVAGEITIGVAGPMNDIQGEHHWAGAEMAVADIGGIMVGATNYTLKLLKIDTNEVHGPPGDGYSAMLANIAKVDFVVGGFRTEAVTSYREVAMDDEVIFFNCGAATEMLQKSVVLDYDRYKYWFKATPYNETFLVTSLLKMTATAAKGLRDGLAGADSAVLADYKIGTGPDYTLRVAIIVESLSWAHGIVAKAVELLPELLLATQNITMEVVAVKRPSATAVTLVSDLQAIAEEQPHIIFTSFSGPVGVAFSKERADYVHPAMVIGINVEGQSLAHWTATAGGCEYDMMLDTWAVGVNQTSLTKDWFEQFVTDYEDYPTYTAGTYDAIFALKEAIETTGVGLDPAKIITWLEDLDNAREGVGAVKTAFYPMPGVTIDAETGEYALSEDQVLDYYPWLDGLCIEYGVACTKTWAYDQTEWLVGPHTAHDTVYGPGYQTGIGVIWYEGAKVGWWPLVAPGLESFAGLPPEYIPAPYQAALWFNKLLDNYGNWNFEYDGNGSIAGYLGTIVPWFCGVPF